LALFERISLLVVEDEDYMLSLLRQILHSAGFRNIRTAKNGREATGILAATKQRFSTVAGAQIDIVIADAFMPIINGTDLLRWLRQDAASPNRFLPYILMSGEADEGLVFNCRDVGVSEILAKPFSVQTLMTKIMQVIERPRPYVLNRNFFGPDRRRLKTPLPSDAEDRRVMPKDKVRRFSSGQTNLNVLSGHTWIFDFPNTLKGKLEVSDPRQLASGIDFGAEIAKAQEALSAAEEETRQWIAGASDKLESFMHEIKAGGVTGKEAVEKLSLLARELRGHGGTFGYPLISQFARSLHIFTESITDVNADVTDLLRAHVDVIKVVVKQDAKRENDPLATEIKSILERAVKKYAAKHGTIAAAPVRTPSD
jgi:CheY-like chemotaxis protein